MSFIYKITNDINNKIYVGKTYNNIEKRFKEHCKDAFREDRKYEKRPLYSAMRKYGIEKFHIELIEECEDDIASEREQYWIGYYKGFEEGYNATLGGDGKFIFNHIKILERLKGYPFPKQVAEEFGCSPDTVSNIAKMNNIQTKNISNENMKQEKSKAINQYDKNNNFIQSFNSVADAAKYCFENQKCKTLNSGVRSHIAECANGKRKSAYGYIWKYDV